MEDARGYAEAEDMDWLYEAVIRYLQGPMYSTPLMGFIDDACLIFDTEEENKLEYTQTHEDFKQLVDTLISDYLLELGVAPEQFAQIVEGCVHKDLNNFVLASILTVDDFVQFKAMMVKRNMDLTQEVLNACRASGTIRSDRPVATGVPVSPQQQRPVATTPYPSSDPATPAYLVVAAAASPGTSVLSSSQAPESPGGSDAVSPELEAVLRMSREQFQLESTRKTEPVLNDQEDIWASNEPEVDDEMARVLAESMNDTRAMQLDAERMELEQAIQLEEEQRRLAQEASTSSATGSGSSSAQPQHTSAANAHAAAAAAAAPPKKGFISSLFSSSKSKAAVAAPAPVPSPATAPAAAAAAATKPAVATSQAPAEVPIATTTTTTTKLTTSATTALPLSSPSAAPAEAPDHTHVTKKLSSSFSSEATTKPTATKTKTSSSSLADLPDPFTTKSMKSSLPSIPSSAMGPTSSKYDGSYFDNEIPPMDSAPNSAAAFARPVPSSATSPTSSASSGFRFTPSFSAVSRGGGAGYSAVAGDAAMTADQRTAAADSTREARERLQSKKEAVEAELRATAATPQTDARTKGFLQAQRVALVARKKAAREAELNEYKQANSDFEAMVQRQRNAAAGNAPASAADADEADRLRAELRRDLARKLKQDLLAKSQGWTQE